MHKHMLRVERMHSTELNQLLEQRLSDLENDPDDPKLRADVAQIFEQLGETEEATLQYNTAARVYINRGGYADAAQLCNRALVLSPHDEAAAALLRGLSDRGLIEPHSDMAAVEQGQPTVADDAEQLRPTPSANEATPTGDSPGPSMPALSPEVAPDRALAGAEARQSAESFDDIDSPGDRDIVDAQSQEAAEIEQLFPSALAERAVEVRVSRGEVLSQREESQSLFYMLLDGQIELHSGGELQGTVLERLGAGEFFGEVPLLGDGKWHCAVIATLDTTLLAVPGSDVFALMQNSPEVNRLLRGRYRDRMRAALLHVSPLFSALHERVARRFLRQFVPQWVRAGQTVLTQGAVARGLFVVFCGEVVVTAHAEGSERDTELSRLGHGDFFGEISLLRRSPCTATVTCVRDTQLGRLAPEAFEAFAAQRPRFKALLDKQARERERQNHLQLGAEGASGAGV